MKKTRLSRSDWIFAGFTALAQDGPASLKAEPLARRLSATKGSFYWHFRDVSHFHDAMLDFWETRAVTDIIKDLDRIDDPRERLRQLAQIATAPVDEINDGQPAEPAIRAWARSDPKVQIVLNRVDERRLDYLGTQLDQAGLSPEPYARMIYAQLIGLEGLSIGQQDNPRTLSRLVEFILSLG
ncbi:MAG: TetR/AcrR family transcriptional regulator [Pseudomonadota bacterium]